MTAALTVINDAPIPPGARLPTDRFPMKTSWFKFAGVLSLAFAAASVTGCGAGDVEDFDGNQDMAAQDDGGYAADESIDESSDLGTAQQGLMSCSNPDGANS